MRRVPVLREVGKTQEPIDQYPSVSAVVPARDEEVGVGEALRSLLDHGYPGRPEVLAVDDRSTGLSSFYAALHPFGTGVFVYRTLRSAWVVLSMGASSGGAPSTA